MTCIEHSSDCFLEHPTNKRSFGFHTTALILWAVMCILLAFHILHTRPGSHSTPQGHRSHRQACLLSARLGRPPWRAEGCESGAAGVLPVGGGGLGVAYPRLAGLGLWKFVLFLVSVSCNDNEWVWRVPLLIVKPLFEPSSFEYC